MSEFSMKNCYVALILVAIFGSLGFHRFYTGRWITGIIWLLTCGCLGIGVIVDVFLIALGKFKDSDGCILKVPYLS